MAYINKTNKPKKIYQVMITVPGGRKYIGAYQTKLAADYARHAAYINLPKQPFKPTQTKIYKKVNDKYILKNCLDEQHIKTSGNITMHFKVLIEGLEHYIILTNQATINQALAKERHFKKRLAKFNNASAEKDAAYEESGAAAANILSSNINYS